MKTILVVEDESDFAESLDFLLTRSGYRVLLAYDGREGFEKAVAERPDLVLTDLMMPVMDGQELIERLRANPATSRIPVIAMSASHQARRADMLHKPFDVKELLARVRRVLREH
jgi:two-component system chemotaxis response regulator CheY